MIERPAASLPEIHASVSTTQPSIWRRMFAFAGPAYLVSVGYMDPGNWATDLEGGARFGYQLLWVLVMSNLMAILLQTLSARLGIVAGRDLAQACRDAYPRPISWALWILCEIAIAATDLAEVLGAAIGLNLLFGLPLVAGVVLMAADTLLILWFTRFGIRILESIILAFVTIIGVCFLVQIVLAQPVFSDVLTGLVPRINRESLYVAIGILGATVMPHNLYLHSALVQTRQVQNDERSKRQACKYNLIDSVVALNGALLVNAAILVLAGSVFFQRGILVTEIKEAHLLLAPLLGTGLASAAFAIALLASGQSSTITGTMAGQIVMEGFLNFRMRPWLRRLITRLVAVIPAVITITTAGEQGTYQLLILSQVVLSLQLPFAVIPLIRFTSDGRRMGPFANARWVKVLAWVAAAVIVGLNLWLVVGKLSEWIGAAGDYRWLVLLVAVPVLGGIAALLGYITLDPWLPAWLRRSAPGPAALPSLPAPGAGPRYRRILLPLDHSSRDAAALDHAVAMARPHGARVYLLHIEEGVTSQWYGPQAASHEIEAGRAYFEGIQQTLSQQGVDSELVVLHAKTPSHEIVRFARELKPDLIVMGAHGHKGLQDIVFGATINEVRHALDMPLLIVRDGSPD
ncbi:MAG: Nramp family divalent metal transporter [Bryobacteraceae bacterium]|nr:Nramp family divalent metal transporter [Bryobacteraceae bacterium]